MPGSRITGYRRPDNRRISSGGAWAATSGSAFTVLSVLAEPTGGQRASNTGVSRRLAYRRKPSRCKDANRYVRPTLLTECIDCTYRLLHTKHVFWVHSHSRLVIHIPYTAKSGMPSSVAQYHTLAPLLRLSLLCKDTNIPKNFGYQYIGHTCVSFESTFCVCIN